MLEADCNELGTEPWFGREFWLGTWWGDSSHKVGFASGGETGWRIGEGLNWLTTLQNKFSELDKKKNQINLEVVQEQYKNFLKDAMIYL